MNWNSRTLLRLFLLVGGLVMLYFGTVEDNTAYLLLAVVAIVLGGIGVASEYRDSEE